jgi:hypothetical protein
VIITEGDLNPLPFPIQRYLRFTQVVGKPRVKCVKVRQAGWMRTSPNQNWLTVEAGQYSIALFARPHIFTGQGRKARRMDEKLHIMNGTAACDFQRLSVFRYII